MMNDIIEQVMEYYKVNKVEAMRIISLRQRCGEYDELLMDLREEREYVSV